MSSFSGKRNRSCYLKDEQEFIRRKWSIRAGKSMFKQRERHLQRPWAGRKWNVKWGGRVGPQHTFSPLCTGPLIEIQAAYSSHPYLDLPTCMLLSIPTHISSFYLRSHPSSLNVCFSVGLLETNCIVSSCPKMPLFHLLCFLVTLFSQQLY